MAREVDVGSHRGGTTKRVTSADGHWGLLEADPNELSGEHWANLDVNRQQTGPDVCLWIVLTIALNGERVLP